MTIDFDVITKIKTITELLDEIDKYEEELPNKQRDTDYRLSDLYHYIENNKLKTNECYRIVKEIKKQRELRRKINKDISLLKVFKDNHLKLNRESNRKLLLADIHKKNKDLNGEYKNRIYTEDNINEIIGGKEKCL